MASSSSSSSRQWMKPYEGILHTLTLCKNILPNMPEGASKNEKGVVFETLGHFAAEAHEKPPLPRAVFETLVLTKKVSDQNKKPNLDCTDAAANSLLVCTLVTPNRLTGVPSSTRDAAPQPPSNQKHRVVSTTPASAPATATAAAGAESHSRGAVPPGQQI